MIDLVFIYVKLLSVTTLFTDMDGMSGKGYHRRVRLLTGCLSCRVERCYFVRFNSVQIPGLVGISQICDGEIHSCLTRIPIKIKTMFNTEDYPPSEGILWREINSRLFTVRQFTYLFTY